MTIHPDKAAQPVTSSSRFDSGFPTVAGSSVKRGAARTPSVTSEIFKLKMSELYLLFYRPNASAPPKLPDPGALRPPGQASKDLQALRPK